MQKTTESPSHYQDLDKQEVTALLAIINKEDATVAAAVEKAIPAIAQLVEATVKRLSQGGRLFYIGSGTSGRLGIVDASECPPTYGIPQGIVVGIIAGGDQAIRKAKEGAEDSKEAAASDLIAQGANIKDVVVGISASGSTPYVIGALEWCKSAGITTGAISCNRNADASTVATHPIEVVVGPEVVTGSTRMKAGTAQKLVLNMLTTTTMIKLGHVVGNKMVDMQLTNNKLIERGIRMIREEQTQLSTKEAEYLLQQHGSVRAVLNYLKHT